MLFHGTAYVDDVVGWRRVPPNGSFRTVPCSGSGRDRVATSRSESCGRRDYWRAYADEVLADEGIVMAVYEALAKRRPKSRCRGRRGAPADMVLRLLISSTFGIGALRCWSARFAPIWCTGTLPTWAAPRCQTPRRWGGGAWRLVGLRQELDEMTLRVRQVMKQTRTRIFRGNTRSDLI
jgi:hypothetical protein